MVGLPDSVMCFSKVHTYSFAACLVVFGTVPLNYRREGQSLTNVPMLPHSVLLT